MALLSFWEGPRAPQQCYPCPIISGKAHSEDYFLSNVVINVATVGDSGMRSGIPFPSQTGCNYSGTVGSSLSRHCDWGGRSKTPVSLPWLRERVWKRTIVSETLLSDFARSAPELVFILRVVTPVL